MKKQIFLIGTVAALSAWAPQITAAEAEVKADVNSRKAEARTEITRDQDSEIKVDVDRAKSDRVLKSNKASGIIGMEVRNKENQKLGEVKDLVMDMNAGRLSYAVLSVGGFLGVGEKLIALPPGALKVAGDGEYLLLDADKSKIQSAPGFAATAWPAPNDPEINRYWTDLRATGSPARSETSRSTEIEVKGDVDDGKAKLEVDKDKKGKIYTDADGDKKIKIEAEKD